MNPVNYLSFFLLFWSCNGLLERGERDQRPLPLSFSSRPINITSQCEEFGGQVKNGNCRNVDNIDEFCQALGGTFDRSSSSCEGISENQCSQIGGQVNPLSQRCDNIFGQSLKRPSDQIFITPGSCLCQGGRPQSVGEQCTSFCSNNNTADPTAFISATVGPDIELNENFRSGNSQVGNIFGWCFNQIPDGNVNPNCVLEATDANLQTFTFNTQISPNSNRFSANIVDLPFDRVFIFKLKEVTSNAQSRPFQLLRTNREPPQNPRSILNIYPINLYTCINTATNGANPPSVEFAVKQYYLFPTNSAPAIIPPSQNQIPQLYCHDISVLGFFDNIAFPRLETRPNHFHVWNPTDTRFFDLNRNNRIDINEEIEDELQAPPYNLALQDISIFTPFNWPNSPLSESPPLQGFIMQPFVDSTNNEVLCPKLIDYTLFNADAPSTLHALFEVIGRRVGVSTEAIYLAKKETQMFLNENQQIVPSPDAFIVIKKSQLERIWFSIQNGQVIPGSTQTSKTQTMHFYWPPCETPGCGPLVRQPGQKLFTIKNPNEMPNGQIDNQVLLPADKRIGCVPSSDAR